MKLGTHIDAPRLFYALLLFLALEKRCVCKVMTGGNAPQAKKPHEEKLALTPAPVTKGKFQPFTIPWYNDTKFSKGKARNIHWCGVANQALNGSYTESLTRRAFMRLLEGRDVAVVMMKPTSNSGPNFLAYNSSSHSITGGFIPEMLDEIARRTGLRWRQSVAVVDPPESSNKETYNSWLLWASHNYDVIAGAFTANAERRTLGIRFGFPFLDSSPVLVGVVEMTKPDFWTTFFSWTHPFTYNLWYAIIASFIFTALVYRYLEGPDGDFHNNSFHTSLRIHEHGECWKFIEHIGHSLTLTIFSFTGAGTHTPITKMGKMFICVWSFCVLLIVAAYTANLATFLIAQSEKTSVITGVNDAIRKHVPICVYKGGAWDDFFRERYNDLLLNYPKEWGYHNVREKKCGAIVKDAFYFRIDKGKKTCIPRDRTKACEGNCDLDILGMPITSVSSSFVGGRGSTFGKCSDLALEVMDAALQEMYMDGWLLGKQEAFIADNHDSECDMVVEEEEEDISGAKPLDLDRMGGIFVLHALFTIVCVVGHCVLHDYRHKRASMAASQGTLIPVEE